MADTQSIKIGEYVPQNIFDLHMQRIDERSASDEKIAEMRFDKLQNSTDLKFEALGSKVNEKNNGLEAKLDITRAELNGKIDALDAKLNGRIDAVERRLDGVEKAVENLDKSQNKWFAVFGIALAVITIAIPFLTVLAQKFL